MIRLGKLHIHTTESPTTKGRKIVGFRFDVAANTNETPKEVLMLVAKDIVRKLDWTYQKREARAQDAEGIAHTDICNMLDITQAELERLL